MPTTLGGRLVGTIVLLAVVMSLVTIGVDLAITSASAGAAGLPRTLSGILLLSACVAGLVATSSGILLGVYLSGSLRRPLESMVEHVKTEGNRALEGAEYTREEIMRDASLPLEFIELGDVVDDLLERLTERQAELREQVRLTREAEEVLSVVVNESREAKLLLQDGRVVLANPAAELAFGHPPRTLIGAALAELLLDAVMSEDDSAGVDPAAALERALTEPVTLRLHRDDGSPRWYALEALRQADSRDDRVLLTARDVTEELLLHRIRSEIMALVSHDLRTPLAVVVGYLDLLRRPLSDIERVRAIDAAKRDAERMADMLEDLLSAAHAEELLAPAAFVPVPLADLADDVVASLATTHTGRQLRVEAACRPFVLGDEKRLRQALVNLVINAFKFSPADTEILVGLAAEGEHVRLSVTDHGPGVPPSERERVFDRFARLDVTPSDASGFGLGLYIVKIISENHGGRVAVEETPGGGATFVIELPATAP